MRPLKGITGQWIQEQQCIRFSWDAGALGSDRYVFIVGIVHEGSGWKIDQRSCVMIDLSTGVSGSSAILRVGGTFGGVAQKLFFGYSAGDNESWSEAAILQACSETKDFFLEVMIGKAQVRYKMKQTQVEGAELVNISLECSCGIEKNILGYAYSYGGLKVLLPFPTILAGKQEMPPFLVPKGCHVIIMAYDPKFAGNLSIEEKKSLFF